MLQNELSGYLKARYNFSDLKIHFTSPSIFNITDKCHSEVMEQDRDFSAYFENLSLFRITSRNQILHELYCFNCLQVIIRFELLGREEEEKETIKVEVN